jgi:hypothetical protein
MLYRLSPLADVTWCDLPGRKTLELAEKHNSDLDGLAWQPTESRVFSTDLLRIALRHGIATRTGIALDAADTIDLGRSDELRLGQQAIDEVQARLRAQNDEFMERLSPGWTAHGEDLDRRVRETSERVAQEAHEDLTAVLAAPVKSGLARHWTNLGGSLPD